MSSLHPPEFDHIEQQWHEVTHHTDFSLAFLHGALTAECCHQQSRVNALFDEPLKHVQEFIDTWRAHIDNSLSSDDHQFYLPDEGEISDKSQMIKDWASGFVYSMAEVAHVEDPLNVEFCEDIKHIANLTPINEDLNEETERDLAEIEEYCRMGAISMFTEMRND